MLGDITSDMTIIKNGAGQVYWPAFGINTIGSWNCLQGYQVYMQSPMTLAVTGAQLAPESTPISLALGWNMTAYLRTGAMPIQNALAGIVSNLTIAKNGAGQVYWPAYSINTIGSMQPGQGYQMYMTQATNLTYPANDILPKIPAMAALQLPLPAHYTFFRANTGSNATLLIPVSGLPDGAEIGAWTGGHLLIGSGVVHQGMTLLTLWGDDAMTREVDGALDRDLIALTCWSSDQNVEMPLHLAGLKDGLTQRVLSSEFTYQSNAVVLAEIDVAPNLPTHFGLAQNFPNPFNPSTTINYQLPLEARVELIVYNLFGAKVRTLVSSINPAGNHKVIWNARDDGNRLVPSGIYWVHMKAGEYEKTLKMSFIK